MDFGIILIYQTSNLACATGLQGHFLFGPPHCQYQKETHNEKDIKTRLFLTKLEKVLISRLWQFFVTVPGSQLTFLTQLEKLLIFCYIHFFFTDGSSQILSFYLIKTALEGKQGGNKQKRHTFLSLTGGPKWPFRCLDSGSHFWYWKWVGPIKNLYRHLCYDDRITKTLNL